MPNDRLLLAVPADPPSVQAALADAWRGGPAVLPLDMSLPPRVRSRLILALRPGAMVKPGGIVTLPGGVAVADDTVLVVPTSGSTGAQKGVELPRAALDHSVRAGLERTGADVDVPWLCCLPLTHVAGVLVLLRAMHAGVAPLIHDGFDVGRIAAEPGPLHLAVVPTMLRRLLAAEADVTRWRSVLVGGAALPADLADVHHRLTVTYGMTETAGGCVYDGVPLDGVDVAIDDAGRVRIGGPTLMTGYRRGPAGSGGVDLADIPVEVTARGEGLDADGWFTTSDLGRLHPDGTLEVLGRADDVIVTGGENVLATAVARRVEAHPAVAEAAVIGVPDPEWGQRVVAVIVPAQVGAILSLAILRSFVADAMPRHAAPQDLVVVNTLPRLPSGKLDRHALRRAAGGENGSHGDR